MGNCCGKGPKEDLPDKSVAYNANQTAQPVQGNLDFKNSFDR